MADLLGIGDGIPIGPVSKKSWFAANSAYCRAEELDDTETQKVTPFGGRSHFVFFTTVEEILAECNNNFYIRRLENGKLHRIKKNIA